MDKMDNPRYILVTDLGFSVCSIKVDPYLNIDCGTLSPFEHGEVYVLKDGTEVDLDLGNYERFIGNDLSYDNNITAGKIYLKVIQKERKGEFLGRTVQIVPHVTNEIVDWIRNLVKKSKAEFGIIELGGTIGDIEGMAFIEAFRQLRLLVGSQNFLNIHVSLVPTQTGEQKTKPTQMSVRELRSLGIIPDIIVTRSEKPISEEVKQKISLFCFSNRHSSKNIISCHDVKNILEVPLLLLNQKIDEKVLTMLGFNNFHMKMKKKNQLENWKRMLEKMEKISKYTEELKIAIVGKYINGTDTYFSVVKSLQHASFENDLKLKIIWIESSDLIEKEKNKKVWDKLKNSNGILIPGGFGARGIEGKIAACKYARENGVPFFGICLGFQVCCVEFARNVLLLENANSTEFDKNTKYPIVMHIPSIEKEKKGGNMKLGLKETLISTEKSLAFEIYQNKHVFERHRHRYEINDKFLKKFEEKGLKFVGKDKNGNLEICEVENHPFYFAVQYHPEFQSKPMKASKVFSKFIHYSNKLKHSK